MIKLLLLIAAMILGIKSQVDPCGFDRTNMLIDTGSGDPCNTVTLQRNCALTVVLDPNALYGSSKRCVWDGNTGTCQQESTSSNCYSSCFVGGRQFSSASSCSSFNSATLPNIL